MGAISGEWKAWETVNGRDSTPWASSSSTTASSTTAAPLMVTFSGPLTAATFTLSA